MVHNEIHAIDLAMIAAYLIAMVLIGLVVVKKVKSMDDTQFTDFFADLGKKKGAHQPGADE